jgi:choline monooxygenase
MEHIVPPVAETNTQVSGLWMYLQPTLAINYYGSGVNFERMVPTGPHSTEIRYTFLFQKGADPAVVKESLETSYVVTQEDVEICEGVQRSFDSRAYSSPGPLSPRHENGIAYFQDIIRKVHD